MKSIIACASCAGPRRLLVRVCREALKSCELDWIHNLSPRNYREQVCISLHNLWLPKYEASLPESAGCVKHRVSPHPPASLPGVPGRGEPRDVISCATRRVWCNELWVNLTRPSRHHCEDGEGGWCGSRSPSGLPGRKQRLFSYTETIPRRRSSVERCGLSTTIALPRPKPGTRRFDASWSRLRDERTVVAAWPN